jgi:BirA family transcriptional regulator, biotin operon repressor / biotin---[acetyl-CoA-carboxylase] ligase
MSVRDSILELLEKNKGRAISGEELAGMLGVSRASVWKAVQSLREEGYPVVGAPNRGYTLQENDILSAAGAAPFLKGAWQIVVLDCVDSTNAEMRRRAQGGAQDRTVVAANAQTEGRGRRGKTFFSPRGTGLYFSALLRPKMNLRDASQITCRVAVAVARAIEKLAGASAQIKWVNDIYINGRKVCGILSEAASELESGGLEYIVVGIGINVSTRDFPADLKEIASSIPQGVNRSELLAEVLNQIDICLDADCMAEYKSRSCVLGKTIEIIYTDRKEPATALDIDSEGRLLVRDSFGNLKLLCSGEISVKISNKKMGEL